jgi:hypothetical protein
VEESLISRKDRRSSRVFDIIVLGGGIYGKHIALQLHKRGKKVCIIEKDDCKNFGQSKTGVASLVNQARIHNGYHYPRSIATAMHSTKNYQKFIQDFKSAVINFQQIYAIPKFGSLTSASQFETFCQNLDVRCEPFQPKDVNHFYLEGCYLTDEKAIDTLKMMELMRQRTIEIPKIHDEAVEIKKISSNQWVVHNALGFEIARGVLIINCTYANIQNIEVMLDMPQSEVRYEACEVALFKSDRLANTGYTFMDGPFVSIMPFNQSDIYSLTSVLHTPHFDSSDPIGSVEGLTSAYPKMLQQLKLYLSPKLIDSFEYVGSEYVVKTIPNSSNLDDNRLVQINWKDDYSAVSVLGGKLNAIYDLDELIQFIEHLL